jgi:type III pantothenate kinase
VAKLGVLGKTVLAADVGNSEIDLAIFEGEQLVAHARAISRPRTADEVEVLVLSLLSAHVHHLERARGVLCSVVPSLTPGFAGAIERLTGHAPFVVTAETVRSLPIRYRNPSEVGPDRIATAVALRRLHGAPSIAVDLGTATTFDVVGSDGEYLGGAIMPGVISSSEELYRRAARLSAVELAAPERAIGRSAEECLRSGILYGAAGAVDGIVRRIQKELHRQAPVVATGGLARLVAPHCQTVNSVDETLTLEGLRWIAQSERREAASISVSKPRSSRRRRASR